MALMKEYDIGDAPTLQAIFQDRNGANIDPDEVFFSLRNPLGAENKLTFGTDLDLKNPAPGVYEVEVNIYLSGYWYYRWFSTGDGQAAEEGRFYVRPQKVEIP